MTRSCVFILLLSIIAIFLVPATVLAQEFEGDRCALGRQAGVCAKAHRCADFIVRLIDNNVTPQLCGFSGHEPIVCCPTSNLSPRPVGQKAREVCAQHVPVVKPLECTYDVRFIIGGNKTRPGQYPFMAALGYDATLGGGQGIAWLCGGTLISEQYVLTAAHCLYSPSWGAPIVVRLGDHNLAADNDGSKPQQRNVAERIKHPLYKPPTWYHDIALIKMDSPVVLDDFVQIACVPPSSETLSSSRPPGVYVSSDSSMGIATGWGLLDWTDEKGSNDLMAVSIPFRTYENCNKSYGSSAAEHTLPFGIVKDWQICAGSYGKDTCQGDSGGPLTVFNLNKTCMHNVVGVTSAGKLCGTDIPGIYTKVSNYVKWIEDIVWPDT